MRSLVIAACAVVLPSLVTGEATSVGVFEPPHKGGVVKDYASRWFQLNEIEPSTMHWGQNVRVFMNGNVDVYVHNYRLLQALWSDDIGVLDDRIDYWDYPRGAVLVKENFVPVGLSDYRPLTLTVMIKREPGYDPQYGDWEYLQSDVKGNVLLRGNSQDDAVRSACMGCHINVAERDYVYSINLTEPEGHLTVDGVFRD